MKQLTFQELNKRILILEDRLIKGKTRCDARIHNMVEVPPTQDFITGAEEVSFMQAVSKPANLMFPRNSLV